MYHGLEVEVRKAPTNIHEIQALSQLRHPNIVGFIGACISDSHSLIVTERMATGSLSALYAAQQAIRPSWLPSKATTLGWCLDLIRAVNYMHQSDPCVSHNGLHPDILLLSGSGILKVSGFASCTLSTQTPPITSPTLPDLGPGAATSESTPPVPSPTPRGASESPAAPGPAHSAYAAPELRAAGDPAAGRGPSADVFAAAMVMWFVRTARHPTPATPGPAGGAGAWGGAGALRWPGLAALVARAAARDPAARPTADELTVGLEGLRAARGLGWRGPGACLVS